MNVARWTALRWFIGPALLAHKGRHLAALFAVAAGIALAVAIHTVNQSAISEFQAATAKINGNAQLQIRGRLKTFDESIYPLVAKLEGVAYASPVIEIDTALIEAQTIGVAAADSDAPKKTKRMKLIGIDVFQAANITPALLPKPSTKTASPEPFTTTILSENTVFIGALGTSTESATETTNTSATTAANPSTPAAIKVQGPVGAITLAVKGTLLMDDASVGVMDIASAQQLFGQLGQLSRIDLSLKPGESTVAMQALLKAQLPADMRVVLPSDEGQRASNLSRAYRVNLTVLALVALVSGGMIVFSALGAGVLQQWPQIALISLLGASRRFVMMTVLIQGLLLGAIGTVLGLVLGYALAAGLLFWVGTDLGGGYFSGKPAWPTIAVLDLAVFACLGIACGLFAAWIPARSALAARSADALKPGHGERSLGGLPSAKPAILLGIAGSLLAFAPAIDELPLAGYAAIACWLFGGVAAVPYLVSRGLAWLAKTLGQRVWRFPSLWLALHRTGQSPGLAINEFLWT